MFKKKIESSAIANIEIIKYELFHIKLHNIEIIVTEYVMETPQGVHK